MGQALKTHVNIGMFETNFHFFHSFVSKPRLYLRFKGIRTCAQKSDTSGDLFSKCDEFVSGAHFRGPRWTFIIAATHGDAAIFRGPESGT